MTRLSLAAMCLAAAMAQPATAFDLQGHRGARGLAPENTLVAFATALSLGVTTLEFDVGVTQDGIAVVSHDPVLNPDFVRGPDGMWLSGPGPAIFHLPLAELRRFDVGRLRPGTRYAQGFPDQVPADGARIPTLAEVFALAAKAGNREVRFNIETKLSPLKPTETLAPDTFAEAVVMAVRAAGVERRSTIQSFDWRTLLAVQRRAPEIDTVYLTIARGNSPNVRVDAATPWTAGLSPADHGGSIPRTVKAAGGRVWSPNFGDLDAAAVAEAKTLGLAVVPWTVNRDDDMARLIDWGVDGIITDYPNRLRRLLQARGMPVPRPTPVVP
jgi:glycerophosphoryl diester phosphodiesterase